MIKLEFLKRRILMNRPNKFLPYLTRPTYLKTRQMLKETGELNVNRMIWDRDIYLMYQNEVVDIVKINNGILQKLEYMGCELFFIREDKASEMFPLLFWVNILEIGGSFENKLNDDMITFNVDEKEIYSLTINGRVYKTIHIGNVLTRYITNIKKISFDSQSVNYFYKDVQDYLDGIQDNIKFEVSTFGNHAIVYRVK